MRKTLLLIALVLLSGCASMTEEYWQEKYANMTEEEKESAKNLGPDLITVCDNSGCGHIWIY